MVPKITVITNIKMPLIRLRSCHCCCTVRSIWSGLSQGRGNTSTYEDNVDANVLAVGLLLVGTVVSVGVESGVAVGGLATVATGAVAQLERSAEVPGVCES